MLYPDQAHGGSWEYQGNPVYEATASVYKSAPIFLYLIQFEYGYIQAVDKFTVNTYL